MLALSGEIAEADALARFMEMSIADQKVVTLSAMDEPNLIPMFNSYCLSAPITKNILPKAGQMSVPSVQRR